MARRRAEARRRTLLLAPLALAAGLAVPYFLVNEETEPLGRPDQRFAGTFVELSRGHTHYQLGGPEGAPLVVLVHGMSVPMFVWDPTFGALAASGRRVLRYDLYGRGLSARPDIPYTQDLYDEQLSELLAKLAPSAQVDLVGLSMGGLVVTEFTRRHPERVRKLVLVDSAGLDVSTPAMAKVGLLPGVGEYVLRVAGSRQLLPSRRSLRHPERHPDLDTRLLSTLRYQGTRRAVLESLRRMPLSDYGGFAQVGALGKPTFVVWGREDKVIPLASGTRLAEQLRAGELLVVDDAGHLPHLEKPEVVNPALLGFLAR
jgi:pimeloyl-ACP methyl ester carboxylesterase